MRRKSLFLSGAFLFAALVFPSAPAVAEDEDCTATENGYTCIYGPYTVVGGRASVGTDFVGTPPEAGYITSARATLVDEDGKKVDPHAVHLHHAVWINPAKEDFTCPDLLAGLPGDQIGDRFFATGKERTKLELPEGYGYYWSNEGPIQAPQYGPLWGIQYHFDGMHEDHDQDVYLKLNLGFTPASESTLTEVEGVWLDVDNCSDAEFDIKKTKSGIHKEKWSYTMPVSGSFIAMAGHLHDYGIKLKLRNMTAAAPVFTSKALYENNKDPWYLTSMTTYSGVPGLHVSEGDELKLTAVYNSEKEREGAMGIMLSAFVRD